MGGTSAKVGPVANGKKVVVKKKAPKRKLNISDAERERRSVSMKERVRAGKVGAKFGKLGGRPKIKRASELVAEEAQKEADKIVTVFKDAISPNQTIGTRLKGAQMFLEVEKDERRLEMDEEEHFQNMSQNELAKFLADEIEGNPTVRAQFLKELNDSEDQASPESADNHEDVIDADVVEED